MADEREEFEGEEELEGSLLEDEEEHSEEPEGGEEEGEQEEPAAEGEQDEGEEESEGEDEGAEVEEAMAPASCPTCPDTDFQKYIADRFGGEVLAALKNKYGSDDEIIKGLVNAHWLVGRQDAESQLFRELRSRLGDDRLVELLTEVPGAKTALATSLAPGKADEIEFDPEWYGDKIRVDPQTGQFIPGPTGTKRDVAKFRRYLAHREKVLNEFARNPKKFVESHIDSRLAAFRESLLAALQRQAVGLAEETSRQFSERATVEQIIAEAAPLLFVNGQDETGGLTKLGEAFKQYHDELAADGMRSPSKRVILALAMAQGRFAKERAKPKEIKNAAKRGVSSAQKRPSVEDLLDRGYGLAEAFEMASRHEE